MRPPSFDLRLVAVFCVVAQEQHLDRAAERLGLTPATVTAQLTDLEAQLGPALVRHEGRSVRLTPAGDRFLEEARRIVSRAIDVAVRLRGDDEPLRVRLGVASNPVVRAVVAAFAAERPAITMQVTEVSGSEAVAAVVSGTADVGFDVADGVPAGTSFAVLDRQPLGVVTPTSHPLARHDTAPWSGLAGERVYVAPPGVADSYNALVRAAVERAGVAVAEVLGPAVPSLTCLVPALAAGAGLALCSRYAYVPLPPGLAWTVLCPPQHLEIGVVWDDRGASPATRLFVDLARWMAGVTPG